MSETQEPFPKDPKQISEIKQGIILANKRGHKVNTTVSKQPLHGGRFFFLYELNTLTFMTADFLLRAVVFLIYQDCVLCVTGRQRVNKHGANFKKRGSPLGRAK